MSDMRLLVMDDDRRIGQFIARLAKPLGYSVCVETESSRFDAVFAEFRPTLLVLDLVMRDRDGIEILLKLGRQNCRQRVILISGADRSLIAAADRLGQSLGLAIIATLQKPLDIDDLGRLLTTAGLDDPDGLFVRERPRHANAGLGVTCPL